MGAPTEGAAVESMDEYDGGRWFRGCGGGSAFFVVHTEAQREMHKFAVGVCEGSWGNGSLRFCDLVDIVGFDAENGEDDVLQPW